MNLKIMVELGEQDTYGDFGAGIDVCSLQFQTFFLQYKVSDLNDTGGFQYQKEPSLLCHVPMDGSN